MILKIKNNKIYIWILCLLLAINIIFCLKHYRFTTSTYGDNYYRFANDLMERSPLYTSSILPKGKTWIVENEIYEKLEFKDWELKLYLKAKQIFKVSQISKKKCEFNNDELVKNFNLAILKGNKKLGYSSFQKQIKVFKNENIYTKKILLYNCINHYVIEMR